MTEPFQSKRPQIKRLAPLAAVLVGITLGGCSSMVDHVPSSMGGLPEGVPARPATPTPFPSVHDMPPPRQDNALSEADSKRLREELKNSRKRGATPQSTGTTSPKAGETRNP